MRFAKSIYYLLPFGYFLAAQFVVNSPIGEASFLGVVYRPIYVPLAFWALTFLYAYAFGRIIKLGVSLPKTLALGLFLHLALLLPETYFSKVAESADMAFPYKLYIAAVMYAAVYLCASLGVEAARGFLFNPPSRNSPAASLCEAKRRGMDSAMNSASAFFSHRRSEERDSTGVSPWSFKITPAAERNAVSSLFFLPFIFLFLQPLGLALENGMTRSALISVAVVLLAFLASLANANRRLVGFLKRASAIFGSKKKIIFLLFVLAFALRLGFGIGTVQKTQGAFPTASDDGTTYDMHGYKLSKDISYIRDTVFAPSSWDLGYSFFLGFIYRIFGHSFYLAVVVQSLIGAFVPVMTYLLAALILERRAAAIAGIWCALDQPLIMLSSVLGQEALYIPLLTLIVLMLTKYAVERKKALSAWSDVLIGALFGAASVVRSAVIYLLPVIGGYVAFVKDGRPILRKVASASLIVLTALAVIAPVTSLNFLNSGEPYLLTKPKPLTNWAADEGHGWFFPGNKALADMGIEPFSDPLSSALNILRNPGRFAAVESDILFRRAAAFFFCYNFGFFDPIYMVNAAKLKNRFAPNLEFYIVLLVLAGFFAIIADPEKRRKAWPILLVIGYYVLMHVVVFRMGSIRYRAPIHPYLIIFGALGLRMFVNYVKEGFGRIR
jgi:hypothetical protein